MDLEAVKIDVPPDLNVIIGQAHFIKSVEDIYEAVVASVPQAKFGLAFCEASGKCLVRVEGNDEQLKAAARDNALALGCGHTFIIILKDAYPINILNQIKSVPEVCRIFCATANPLQAIIARVPQGKDLLGVVDGFPPRGAEREEDVKWRKDLLRSMGYKL